jgi:hypothetical protein
MFERAEKIRNDLEDLVTGVDPGMLDGPQARGLFEVAVAIERRAGALRLLVTQRL